jgi:uncharacterized protein (DUF1501 family)
MRLTRRQFLTGGASLAALTLGPRFARLPGTHVSYAAGPGNAIVVFVQLFGGNDGINMVYPLTGQQRTRYEQVRPTLQLPTTTAGLGRWTAAGYPAAINDIGANSDSATYALHPTMTALHQVYQAGRLAVIPGVHYTYPDYSHFRSSAIWWTADPLGPATFGWFARYLNASGFTSAEVPGVVIAGGVNPMFVPTTQTSIFAFTSLSELRYPADGDNQRKEDTFKALYQSAALLGGSYPEAVRIGQTGQASIDKLSLYYVPGSGLARAGKVESLLLDDGGAYRSSNPLVYDSPLNAEPVAGMDLAQDLRHVAAAIRANVGARFFHVSIGGFDTHSNQDNGDLWHSGLLYELSAAVAAFYDELKQSVSLPAGYDGSAYLTGSQSSKVVIVFFSEFGRTIHQNSTNPDTAGTDHAASAPMIVLGDPVVGGQYGDYPQLADPADGANGNDLKMTYDFRDVFGTVLARWLNVPVGTIGPGSGKIFTDTPVPDENGESYTTFTPIGFLAP